jgi:hypothetical protein
MSFERPHSKETLPHPEPELQIIPAVPETDKKKNGPEISPGDLDDLINKIDREEKDDEPHSPTIH